MKKKLISIVLAGLMVAALCVPAFAASLMSGNREYNDIYGHDYYAFTMLNTDRSTASANVFLVCKDADTQNVEYVPTGYMGINSQVMRQADKKIIVQTGMIYNTTPYYFVEYATAYTPFTGFVCGCGEVEIYNGTGYYKAKAPQTPYADSTSTNRVSSSTELNKFIDYPQNSSGQTYGSKFYAEQAGGDPDLISAVGVGGVEGYIKSEDLNPKVNNPMEAMEYMVNFNSNRVIPLYDKEGVRIGSFVLEAMEEEVVNGARQALAEMKAELARAS